MSGACTGKYVKRALVGLMTKTARRKRLVEIDSLRYHLRKKLAKDEESRKPLDE